MNRSAVFLLLSLAGCVGAPSPTIGARFDRDDAENRVLVFDGEHQIVGWQYGEEFAIPHWFPLKSPSGRDLLAQHPEPFGHHRAMWVADKVQLEDGEVVDFYHCFQNRIDEDDARAGHRHFIRALAKPRCAVERDRVVVDIRLEWVVDGEQRVLVDERRMVVRPLDAGEVLIDLSWTLRASSGAVTFHSDWVHYAWPYLRIHPQFSVQKGGGTITDDAGRINQQGTDGNNSRWIDYSATVDGVTEGVAVFASRDGSKRKWLTRDYGTFGPRRRDERSGTKFTLEQGERLTGSVRLYVHRGDAVTGNVGQRYEDYCREAGR